MNLFRGLKPPARSAAQDSDPADDRELHGDKDYRLSVVQAKEGFFCTIQLAAKVDLPPEKVFAILARPDSRNVFRSIDANPYRKVLEDDGHGRQLVETESLATWRFLMFKGTFSTRLFVWLDEKAGTVFFKLAKPGLMKAFEGKWTIRGCDRGQPLSALVDARSQHGSSWQRQAPQQLEQQQHQQPGFQDVGAHWAKGAASFASNLRGWLPRPEGQATLLTLEQSLQPSVVPPKPLDRAVKGISARQVHYLLEDLRREVERVQAGGELPPWYDLSEWDDSGDTPAAESHSVSLQEYTTYGGGKRRLGLGFASPAASLSASRLAASPAALQRRWRLRP